MSRRTERVAALIRRIVAGAIQHRLNDPRIPTITSITRVEVSDDFTLARIYVSVMAPETQRLLAVQALQSAAGLMRRMIAPELRIRRLPLIEFRLDDSVRQGLETLAVIDQAMRELGETPEWEREDEDEQGPGFRVQGSAEEHPEPQPQNLEPADPSSGLRLQGSTEAHPEPRTLNPERVKPEDA